MKDEPSTVTAYDRDASWYSNPNTSAPKKLHRQHAKDPGMAHCSRRRIMLITEHPITTTEDDVRLCKVCFPILEFH